MVLKFPSGLAFIDFINFSKKAQPVRGAYPKPLELINK